MLSQLLEARRYGAIRRLVMADLDKAQRAYAVIDRVFSFEGGVKDVGDGKGVTRWGQTPEWLRQFKLPMPMTASDARRNYFTWLSMTQLLELCAFEGPLAMQVIDWSVHSGHIIPIRAMQVALGVKADGVIGPVTVRALQGADRSMIAKRVLSRRVRHGTKLVSDEPQDYQRYIEGWGDRWGTLIDSL